MAGFLILVTSRGSSSLMFAEFAKIRASSLRLRPPQGRGKGWDLILGWAYGRILDFSFGALGLASRAISSLIFQDLLKYELRA